MEICGSPNAMVACWMKPFIWYVKCGLSPECSFTTHTDLALLMQWFWIYLDQNAIKKRMWWDWEWFLVQVSLNFISIHISQTNRLFMHMSIAFSLLKSKDISIGWARMVLEGVHSKYKQNTNNLLYVLYYYIFHIHCTIV